MSDTKTVLILCTGNSCRSQMAEALINATSEETWHAVSAGTEPAAEVHPLAIQVLAEIGIRHAGRPKSIDAFRDKKLDLVITVCDDAAETCPTWLGQGANVHIGFPDPAKAIGTEAELLVVFRAVRDSIHERILAYLEAFTPSGL